MNTHSDIKFLREWLDSSETNTYISVMPVKRKLKRILDAIEQKQDVQA